MPRKSEQAYTITYAVLGLLARWGATSGYDLSRWFEQGLGHVWEATHSQIYNELRRLKSNGWATMETQAQETRPDRKVYQITDAGRKALADWLRQPSDLPRIHDELALKTILGTFAPPEALPRLLNTAIHAHQQRLEALQEEVQAHGDPADEQTWQPVDIPQPRDPYIALVVQLGIRFEEMYLHWLAEALQQIEAHQ